MSTDTLIPLTDKQIEILADSGLYLAELTDGRVVDLREWLLSQTEMSGGLFDSIKKIFKKPLKALGVIAGVGLLGAATGIIKGGFFKTLATKTGVMNLVQSKNWTALQSVVRTSLQATGILPTTAQVQQGMQEVIDETVWGTGGTAGTGQPVYQLPETPSYEKYLPIAALALAGVLIIVLAVKK